MKDVQTDKVLAKLKDRYLEGMLDPFMMYNETQKLEYFMQESGELLDSDACFDKVSALIDGFESPFGLELLVAAHLEIKTGAAGAEGCTEEFSLRQIGVAKDRLRETGYGK